jgi:hypothetical protein
VICSKCGVVCKENPSNECTACHYGLSKKKSEEILKRAPTEALSASKRKELLDKEAKKRKVGQTIRLGSHVLVRTDARGGNHQRWNNKAEQEKLFK